MANSPAIDPVGLTDSGLRKSSTGRRLHWWVVGVLLAGILIAAAVQKSGKTDRKTESDEKTLAKVHQDQIATAKPEVRSAYPEDLMRSVDEQEKRTKAKIEESAKSMVNPHIGNGADDYVAPTEESRRQSEQLRIESIRGSPIVPAGFSNSQATHIPSQIAGTADVLATVDQSPLRKRLVDAERALNANSPVSSLAQGLNATLPAEMLQALSGQQGGGSNTARQAEKWQQAQAGERLGSIRSRMPASRYVVHQGTSIPAVLMTAANSQLPGDITAVITRDVYDTIRSQYLIIPRGSKLIGRYDSQISMGQERLMAAFTRIIYPDGMSIDLGNMAMTDSAGRAGAKGDVNNHFLKMLGATSMISFLGKITGQDKNITTNSTGGGSTTVTDAGTQGLSETGQAILGRYRNLAPELSLPQGTSISVMVNRDIEVPPYAAN